LIGFWLRSLGLGLVVEVREIRLFLRFVAAICLVDLKQGLDYRAAVRSRPHNLLLCGAGGDGSATGEYQDSPDHGRNFCAQKVKIRCRLPAACRPRSIAEHIAGGVRLLPAKHAAGRMSAG
jgi:hypothetical protein